MFYVIIPPLFLYLLPFCYPYILLLGINKERDDYDLVYNTVLIRELYAHPINLSTFTIPTWQAAKCMAVPDLVRMNSSSMSMLRRQKGSYLLPVMLLPGRLKGRMQIQHEESVDYK